MTAPRVTIDQATRVLAGVTETGDGWQQVRLHLSDKTTHASTGVLVIAPDQLSALREALEDLEAEREEDERAAAERLIGRAS